MSFSPDTISDSLTVTKPSTLGRFFKRLLLLIIFICLTAAGFGYLLLTKILVTPPTDFPTDVPITIDEGMGVRAITALLAERGYVQSELVLYAHLVLWHDPSTIKASTYRFATPVSTSELATELTQGHFGGDLLRFVHIEGERADHIAEKAAAILPDFSKSEFITLATPHEGKLFPDTYFLPKDYTAPELLELLLTTFATKTAPLADKIAVHDLSLPDILILASIIEREANSEESMRRVSGILQTRLRIGMALQVDASLEPVLGKPLSELTPEDLERENPYNTYQNAGLPPTPIGNPGLVAIEAVLDPIFTNDLFYITGTDGEFYYAETFDQHKINVARYLR
jgi:UPF0755 protein